MTVIMSDTLKEKLERVKKREWWPVALLAEVLEKPRRYIYRRIEEGSFDIIEDAGYMKVLSESVVTFFEGKCNNV